MSIAEENLNPEVKKSEGADQPLAKPVDDKPDSSVQPASHPAETKVDPSSKPVSLPQPVGGSSEAKGKPQKGFCKWLAEKEIKATIAVPLIGTTFEFKLTCETLPIYVGLLLAVVLIAVFVYNLIKPPCGYPLLASDAEAARWLINQEGKAIVTADLEAIKTIFIPQAVIIDADPDAQQTIWYSPTDRYANLFQDYQYTAANHSSIILSQKLSPSQVIYTSASDGSYIRRSDQQQLSYNNPPGSDEWSIEKQDGCWVITQFRFNLKHQ